MHYLTVLFIRNVSKFHTNAYPALFVSLMYIHLHHFDISLLMSYLLVAWKYTHLLVSLTLDVKETSVASFSLYLVNDGFLNGLTQVFRR